MNRVRLAICLVVACVMVVANTTLADTFGSGANQFTIDFMPISGSTSPTSEYGIVSNDFRMGKFEITNGQWNKFKANLSPAIVTGSPLDAYNRDPFWTGDNISANCASWYEAAQFVNWLNISTGHQVAYKFTGTQGTSNYIFTPWVITDTGYNVDNPYRNSNTFYFLPTENEWVKAAYWNGTNLQTYATKAGESLTQGDGMSGTGWNYWVSGSTLPEGPWAAGSGSEELNGTFDMMGNLWEWTESPWISGNYLTDSYRTRRGGSYHYIDSDDNTLASSTRTSDPPDYESIHIGFRVASVPEPATLMLLGLGAVMLRKNGGS